jgi:hypothetical protein
VGASALIQPPSPKTEKELKEMKKVLLIASAILVFASVANAQYVGLYADAGRVSCTVNVMPYTPFECWVLMNNPDRGIQAAEYRVILPAGIVSVATTTNPDINLTLGDWASGISVSFMTCWQTWVWPQHITCLSMGVAPAGFITIEGKPGSLPYYLQIASCELGFPIYPLTILNHLALNQPCEVGTEETSWVAIKSLF